MKKGYIVGLALAVALLSGCEAISSYQLSSNSGALSATSATSTASAKSSSVSSEPASSAVSSSKANSKAPVSSIPPKTAASHEEIYSDDLVSVSFMKKYDRPDLMKGEFFLDIKAENKSDKKITVYLQDVYLNDSMVQIGSGVPLDVLPGKSGANTFFGKYEGTGITNADGIKKIGFKVLIMDESVKTLETTKTIEINF